MNSNTLNCAVVVLLSFFSQGQLMAYPNVGDQATFATRTEHADARVTEGTIFQSAVELSRDGKQLLVRVETSEGGSVLTSTDDWIDLDQLPSPAFIQETLSDCENQGERVSVKVSAGTFEACKIAFGGPREPNGHFWWADVPFGVVQQTEVQADGGLRTSTLTSFTLGRSN